MIPITLKIKGFYSYMEEQVIDFKRLTEAGLFGIFGEVGSGKSAVLEAIALSLYAKSERLNISGDDRYYNMLNLNINEAIIEFKFSTGVQKHVFQSILRLARNKKNFNEVGLRSHNFYRLVNGAAPEPVLHEKVLEAVGISYENFKRTIIIPQGQFKEFLELSSTERTRMLKELFGLQRFELSPKLALIDGENKAALQRTEGELNAHQNVSVDSIAIIETQWQQAKVAAERLQLEKNALDAAVLNLLELKKNISELADKKNSLDQKILQETIDMQQEKEMEEYERLMATFQQPYRDLRKYKDSLDDAEQQLAVCLNRTSDIEKKLKGLSEELEGLTDKANRAEANRNKSIELEKVIVINADKLALTDINQKIFDGEKGIGDITIVIDRKIEEKKNGEQKKLELAKQIIPESILYSTKNWFREINQQACEIESLLQDKESINNQLQHIDAELLSQQLESFTNQLEFESIYNRDKQAIEAALKNNGTALAAFHVQKELQQHAAALVDGQPCMLCGALHHPHPVSMKDEAAAIQELNEQIETLGRKLDKLNGIRVSVTALLQNKTRLTENRETLNGKLEAIITLQKTTLAASPNKAYGRDDIDRFAADEKKSSEANSEFEAIERSVQGALSVIEMENEKLKRLGVELNGLRLNQRALEATMSSNAVGLKEINAESYANISNQEIIKEKEQLLQDILANESALANAKKTANELEKAHQLLSGKMQGINETIEKNKAEQNETRTQLTILIANSGLQESDIVATLRKQLDVPTLRASITENRKIFNLLKGEISTLEKLVAGASFDETIFMDKTAQLHQINEQLTKATEAKGNLEGQLQLQQESMKIKTLLQKQQEAYALRAADIATLKKLFNASGFVEFVSKRYLQNVVALANERFKKMVRQKFGMELSDKGDFLVRDYLNGGKTRSLKSLSGGQTFQAALCLALALSESIQRNAGVDQHFFFLDEGFGSLDKENLQIVLATLQSLRLENRVVGLISHVEELQQEMDVFLKVENDPTRGTIIKESWKN